MKGGLLPLEKRAFVLSVPAPVNSLLDCALLKLWNGDVHEETEAPPQASNAMVPVSPAKQECPPLCQ